jgi:hypothetical protein
MHFRPHKTGACNYMHIWVHEWRNACRILFRCCYPVCLDVGRCNLGTQKILPQYLCCIPNLILLQHTKHSSFSRKCGVPLGHRREYQQVKHIHMGHLGRLRLPVPASRLTSLLDKPQVFSVIVRTSIVALDDGRVSSRASSWTNQFFYLWESKVAKQI